MWSCRVPEHVQVLPPTRGFSHELPHHLNPHAPHKAPSDPVTGLPLLKFDEYCCGAHGLSIFMAIRYSLVGQLVG